MSTAMPSNNKIRRRTRATHQLHFTGVDGEGVNYPDPTGAVYECKHDLYCPDFVEGELHTHPVQLHKYVLLSVGDKSYHRRGAELQFEEILDFLWDCFLDDPTAVYVGFYLTYDFTSWLKSLPEDRARMLLSDDGIAARRRKMGRNPIPFPVYYGEWEFDLHASKRFKLRKRIGGERRWMYINDVGPFFQTSFLTVIETWPTSIYNNDELRIVETGKAQRAQAQLDQDMIRYNVVENLGLSRVMQTLNEGFVTMGVRLKRNQWYGPGQAAQQWLNNIRAPDAQDAQHTVPLEVLEAGRASYYGGWFEIMAHGHIPGVTYEYDINSAYPAAIAGLPCFDHGEWLHNDTAATGKMGEWSLVRASITGVDQYIGAGPHRCRDGTILRPHRTGGWFWWAELHAARNAGCIDEIEVLESWTWVQSCHHRPFSAIAELYTQRQAVGKNTPLGRALKLVYNSAYGKLAQSVGEPRYANPLYASLITSSCRTKIWDAISTHPLKSSSVVMVATDGIFFTSPHPSLPISDRLGDWDMAEHQNLTLFMPGLYWSDATRQKQDGKIRSRGISATDLRAVVGRLDEKWNLHHARVALGLTSMSMTRENRSVVRAVATALNGANAAAAVVEGWPIIAVPIKFGMVSAKLALHRGKWETCGHVPMGLSRVLGGDPSDKRDAGTRYIDDNICRTRPYGIAADGHLMSTPYEKRFGLELRDKQTEAEIICDTGEVNDVLYEWVRP